LLNPITIFLGYLVDLSIILINHPFINPNQSSHDFHGFSLICSYFFQDFHHRCFVHVTSQLELPRPSPCAPPSPEAAASHAGASARGVHDLRRSQGFVVSPYFFKGEYETAMWVKQCHKLSPKSP
jgi:hypothetical protein